MDPSYGSSSGDVGNRYGNKLGANVATSHEMMLARAANKMSGSWPRMVRFLVSLLFAIVVGRKKSATIVDLVQRGSLPPLPSLSGGPSSSSPSSAETLSLNTRTQISTSYVLITHVGIRRLRYSTIGGTIHYFCRRIFLDPCTYLYIHTTYTVKARFTSTLN